MLLWPLCSWSKPFNILRGTINPNTWIFILLFDFWTCIYLRYSFQLYLTFDQKTESLSNQTIWFLNLHLYMLSKLLLISMQIHGVIWRTMVIRWAFYRIIHIGEQCSFQKDKGPTFTGGWSKLKYGQAFNVSKKVKKMFKLVRLTRMIISYCKHYFFTCISMHLWKVMPVSVASFFGMLS